MNNTKVEKTTVDGRRAEIHTTEQALPGATQRITEYLEEIVPLETTKRVTEKIVPVVMERLTEQFNGNQVTKTIEKVAGEDLSLRLTKLVPYPGITKDDVEDSVRKVLNEKGVTTNVWNWFSKKDTPAPVPTPTPAPGPAVDQSAILSYILTILLAAEVGWIVWNLFIR